jgi:hypothetical protein
MWGVRILILDSSIQARRSTAYLSTLNCFSLHDERELGAIKDGSWVEGNVTKIS